eukprot:6176253-Pleurochrysis_carterae.AAC.1
MASVACLRVGDISKMVMEEPSQSTCTAGSFARLHGLPSAIAGVGAKHFKALFASPTTSEVRSPRSSVRVSRLILLMVPLRLALHLYASSSLVVSNICLHARLISEALSFRLACCPLCGAKS